MSSISSNGSATKSTGRKRPAALTACEACRKLKMRCIRPTPAETESGSQNGSENGNDSGSTETQPCERCRRNKRTCTIPEARPLGRRHGATGRYHGLEKAYRRMQAELKKAELKKARMQSETQDGTDEDSTHDFTQISSIDVTNIPDISDITATSNVSVVPTDNGHNVTAENNTVSPADTIVAVASSTPAPYSYDEPAQTEMETDPEPDQEPDPEPMSNPLALLADASSNAAQALVSASSSGENGETTLHNIGVGRRLLRRPGYVSLGLRLSRDTLEQGLDALYAPPSDKHATHANYFKRPPPGVSPARDVGPDLDPVDLGLVTMEEAASLFRSYYARFHPINGILDPILHTPAFVRARSALLFTWIMALTAQFEVGHGAASLAKRLRLHGEKLSHHVHACGFKSVEIIQGYYISLLSASPAPTMAEERSWLYTMYAFGLGSELGLDKEDKEEEKEKGESSGQNRSSRSPHVTRVSPAVPASESSAHPVQGRAQGPSARNNSSPGRTERSERDCRLSRNRQRTWLRILLWERANSAARGRMHNFPETALTRNIERWSQHPLAQPSDRFICAFVLMRRTLADLQRDLHRRAQAQAQSQTSVGDAHWVRNLVDATLRPWRDTWLPPDDDDAEVQTGPGVDTTQTYMGHVYLHARLWTLSFALHRSISHDPAQLHAIRQDCFAAAVQCCESAVRDLQAHGEGLYCMLAPTWAMISYAAVLALSLFPTLYASGSNAGSDSELLALVGQVALQLEKAGTTPPHRYGIAALLGHHLVSILQTRLRTRLRGDQRSDQQRKQAQQPIQEQETPMTAPVSQPQQTQPAYQAQQIHQVHPPLAPPPTQSQPLPQTQQMSMSVPMPTPMPMAQEAFHHRPYPSYTQPNPSIYPDDTTAQNWPDRTPMAYHDGISALGAIGAMGAIGSSDATEVTDAVGAIVDPAISVYNPFWTPAVPPAEGDFDNTGDGFADLFRDMFGPGLGGVF